MQGIAQQKADGNFVIVNVHGGEEYRFFFTKEQCALYESFCDAGADVVFGSHPHVLHPVEGYNGSLIVYSLGNFLFSGMSEMPGATIVKLSGSVFTVEKFFIPKYILQSSAQQASL